MGRETQRKVAARPETEPAGPPLTSPGRVAAGAVDAGSLAPLHAGQGPSEENAVIASERIPQAPARVATTGRVSSAAPTVPRKAWPALHDALVEDVEDPYAAAIKAQAEGWMAWKLKKEREKDVAFVNRTIKDFKDRLSGKRSQANSTTEFERSNGTETLGATTSPDIDAEAPILEPAESSLSAPNSSTFWPTSIINPSIVSPSIVNETEVKNQLVPLTSSNENASAIIRTNQTGINATNNVTKKATTDKVMAPSNQTSIKV